MKNYMPHELQWLLLMTQMNPDSMMIMELLTTRNQRIQQMEPLMIKMRKTY